MNVNSSSAQLSHFKTRHHPLNTNNPLASALMSHSHIPGPPAASSSSFEFMFNNALNQALNAYQERTKKDLLTHPLFSRIQACEYPAAILAVLLQQVQGSGLSLRSSDDGWTIWLDPTVRVLHAFSGIIRGVGMVCLRT